MRRLGPNDFAGIEDALAEVTDELRDFDPTRELGGGPCKRCGYPQPPWRFSQLCQACIWDDTEGFCGRLGIDSVSTETTETENP
jgi:hypothetical protein